jgi:hypothetical protein
VHHRLSFRDQGPEGFLTDVLVIGEINADGQIVAAVSFDLDDIDDAFEELDARYVAGEAAAHAQTWSAIGAAHARFNRHELPATTPDPVYIDHRPLVSIEGVDLAATLRAVWDITPAYSVYIEAVHRLDELGAVATQVLKGTSQLGLDAEWRMIDVFTVEGDLISRVEVFEEADLDAALARFDELHPQAPRLENAASQVEQRFSAYFAARDWDAMAELVSDDILMDDRRHVVNAGVRHGRDAEIASERAVADVGVTNMTPVVIATRGERLALGSYSILDGWSGTKVLCVSEINAKNQIVARVVFDSDDVHAAFAELDARYLAGEAADCAHAWSVIAESYAAFNRHELPAEDLVTVDRRRATPFESSTMTETLRSIWDLTPDLDIRIEAVHRLSSFGAVVTHVQRGTSTEGFDAEWRSIELLTIDADRVNYCEIFDEADLDTALARFDELRPQAPRLENAATQVYERLHACFVIRDWAAITEMLGDGYYQDDGRPVVGGGIRRGRNALIQDLQVAADLGVAAATSNTIAIRGERLALTRVRYSRRDEGPEPFHAEFLQIVETDRDARIAVLGALDLDQIDAAFEELDARYLAGEAAPYARTWSAMARACAAFNQGELPATTANSVFVDHRPGLTVDAVDLPSYLRVMWDVTPDIRVEIVTVHRLSDLGAVVTQLVNETSPEGFKPEWRGILIYTFQADMANRCEVFDESDRDAALARFKELEL